MSERPLANAYMQKAEENFLAAESDYVGGRYNSCANRAYYACFQAAIAALLRDGVRPGGDQWPHTFVQSRFDGQLINRRHRYPTLLRGTLVELQVQRHQADYETASITEIVANRGLRRCRAFVAAIRRQERQR